LRRRLQHPLRERLRCSVVKKRTSPRSTTVR
jgi:hypothetical protein